MIKDEITQLVRCARNGFRLLGAHFRERDTAYFSSTQFFREDADLPDYAERYLPSDNPDAFYALMGVMTLGMARPALQALIQQQDRKQDVERALAAMEKDNYRKSRFDADLGAIVTKNSALPDSEIKAGFSSKFNVVPAAIMELPTDRSVFYAKVNHGYWEYMRDAYADTVTDVSKFREVNTASKIRRLRTSGVTQFWGYQINRILSPAGAVAANGPVSFAISLTAGMEPPTKTLKQALSPVTRGAATGILSMFDTACGVDNYTVGDGGAPRTLVVGGRLGDFFDKFVSDSEACVFLTPRHLKDIDLVPYPGVIYKFLVPHTRVNETWKPVAATFLGYLKRIAGRYRSITILAQGASIASLLALLTAELESEFPGVRLRYFDLGRVLDLTTPDILRQQAWLGQRKEDYVAEGRKIFRQKPATDLVFASLIP